MLLTVQFPLADMRLFAPEPLRRLTKPAWPDAHPGGEFVRGIGGIDIRRLGGLNGWIGEGTHCRASHLLLLDKKPTLSVLNEADYPFAYPIPTRIKFRRLFADGQALVKCEIGLAGGGIFGSDWDVQYDFAKIVDDILALPCHVPGVASGRLLFSGKSIAKRYLQSTTKRLADHAERAPTDVGLVAAGDPLIFIDVSVLNKVSLPKGYTPVIMPGNFDFQLFFRYYERDSFRVPTWILMRSAHGRALDDSARHLRIYLQRIHAEKEVLRLVLDHIAGGKIAVEGGKTVSDSLQRYLLDSTSRIGRLELKADKTAIGGVGALAASCVDFVRPGWLDALTRRLDLMNLRPNIRRNIQARVRRGEPFVNYGVINQVNVDQIHQDNRRGTFMGDIFSNIQNSSIVNRSLVENAFNKIKSEVGEDTAATLLKVTELVAQSGNKEAGEILDQFNEELGKPQPRKSLLKRSWDGLVAVLPAVNTIAGAAAAIAKLFAI
jgi:hypothetical protein